MPNDGKSLEALVATVEEILVPKGFTVTRSEKRYFDTGQQEVEFDVIVRGKVGSGEISWLIECRDRPSAGAAPGSWIEQLHGRQRLYGFNKVSCVTTTGFSEAAIKAGAKLDIDLRTVAQLDRTALQSWLLMDTFTIHNRIVRSLVIRLTLAEDEPEERKQAAAAILASSGGTGPILRSTSNGQVIGAGEAVKQAVSESDLFDRATPDGPEVPLKLNIEYSNDADHFVIDTPLGPVRVRAIFSEVLISVTTTEVPMAQSLRYKTEGADDPIADVVSFGPLPEAFGGRVLEFHRLNDATHIVLRATTT